MDKRKAKEGKRMIAHVQYRFYLFQYAIFLHIALLNKRVIIRVRIYASRKFICSQVSSLCLVIQYHVKLKLEVFNTVMLI